MAYEAPGMLENGERVDQQRARTEVLAQVFADIADGYFQRLKRYEDNIAEAEETIDQMRMVAAGSIAVGLVTAGLGLGSDLVSVGIFGLLIAVGGGLYAYTQIGNAREKIQSNQQNIRKNTPDGKITSVSRIGVPLYAVPYHQTHMIFDGLDTARETTIDLASLDGDALHDAYQGLEQLDRQFQEQLDDESTVSPEVARNLAPGVTDHRELERPITEQTDLMTSIVRNMDKETIDVAVHTNNTIASSVVGMSRNNLLQSNGGLPLVETRRAMSECESLVDEIRGVEEEARGGNLLSQTTEHAEQVETITGHHIRRLENNHKTVGNHFKSYATESNDMMQKHVCEECFEDRIENVTDELSLVREILREGGSLGRALRDKDLDRGTDEKFTERIEEDIRERIPELDEQLQKAYNNLEDLGPDGGFCNTHQEVETVAVADSGAVFGEVWRSLYYEYREPIMENVENMEKDAEEVRQNKEQKMIDLTQYEQIKDNLEREFESVQAEYETAEEIENRLR